MKLAATVILALFSGGVFLHLHRITRPYDTQEPGPPGMIGAHKVAPVRQASPPPSPLPVRIAATTEEFIADLEELLDGTVTPYRTENGGIRHKWDSKTARNNWVQFWDDDGDGTVDFVQIGVGLPNNNDVHILESLATAHRVLDKAEETKVEGPVFTKWVEQSLHAATQQTQHRRFGSTPVRLRAVAAEGGVILLLEIGDEASK